MFRRQKDLDRDIGIITVNNLIENLENNLLPCLKEKQNHLTV